MSLFDTIYRQIGESSIQQLGQKLGLSGARLAPAVDNAIRLTANSFSNLAQTEEGRGKLYESIRYMDDSVVDRPEAMFTGRTDREAFAEGNQTLAELVGTTDRDGLSRSLAAAVEIDPQQADSVVGYLTPGILGSLKREIDRGHVLDNADGIGQLFFGNGNARQ